MKTHFGRDPRAIIIFDKGALTELARLYTRGRSWLELLEDTSTLPTIKKVIIPSVVADMELRGLVFTGKKGEWINIDYQLQDHRLDKGQYFDVLNHFLFRGPRLFQGQGGPIWFSGQGKIEIRDTVNGRKTMDRIVAAIKSAPSKEAGLNSARLMYQKKGLGDQDIIDCIKESDHDGPLFVVTTDKGLASRLQADNVRTLKGNQPTVYNVDQYLQMEANARNSQYPSFKGEILKLENDNELQKCHSFQSLIEETRAKQGWKHSKIKTIASSSADNQDLEKIIHEGLKKRSPGRVA